MEFILGSWIWNEVYSPKYILSNQAVICQGHIGQLKHHTFHEQLICVSTGINTQNRSFCSPLFSEGCWSREKSYIFPLQTAEWAANRQASDPFGRWVARCCSVEPIPGLPTKFTQWKWRTQLVSVPLAVCRVLYVSKNPCSISTEVSIYWLDILLHKTLLFSILFWEKERQWGVKIKEDVRLLPYFFFLVLHLGFKVNTFTSYIQQNLKLINVFCASVLVSWFIWKFLSLTV